MDIKLEGTFGQAVKFLAEATTTRNVPLISLILDGHLDGDGWAFPAPDDLVATLHAVEEDHKASGCDDPLCSLELLLDGLHRAEENALD